jgi:hypothetical protein
MDRENFSLNFQCNFTCGLHVMILMLIGKFDLSYITISNAFDLLIRFNPTFQRENVVSKMRM